MVRQRTPEGKRIVIGVRVTEVMAEAIDAARGGESRSVWVENLIGDNLDITVNGLGKTVNRKAESGECPPHPRGRVIKGFCYRCGSPAT